MTELRIVPQPLSRLETLAQDAQDRHDRITDMLIEELAREDAERAAHPLFRAHDYPLANLGLVEERPWLADNWQRVRVPLRRLAWRLAGMVAIAASIALIIWGIL